jgi:hypothetical protein
MTHDARVQPPTTDKEEAGTKRATVLSCVGSLKILNLKSFLRLFS